jgi:hypothetical protein
VSQSRYGANWRPLGSKKAPSKPDEAMSRHYNARSLNILYDTFRAMSRIYYKKYVNYENNVKNAYGACG